MSYKRLTPCIFIAGGKAVRWFDDRTVLTEDVIALAKQYNANGADELLVFDLSDSDEDHEESIDLMQKNKPDHQYSDGCGRKYTKSRGC